MDQDSQVQFKFEVTNTGSVTLTDLGLVDNEFGSELANLLDEEPLPAKLEPGQSFERILSAIDTNVGQHKNTATASGDYDGVTYEDENDVHYFGANPQIELKKYVSLDLGTTWDLAGDAPGPTATPGQEVRFRFVVTNSGNVTLKNLLLTDDKFGSELTTLLNDEPLPPELEPGQSFERILTGIDAEIGERKNTATAKGEYKGKDYEGTDQAHYKGEAAVDASIAVKKFVSVDGGRNWDPADVAPGPSAIVGKKVQFKFVVINDGNKTLTDLKLSDNTFENELTTLLNDEPLPPELEPGQSFERILTGIDAEIGERKNTAMASGKHNEQLVNDTDDAHYKGILCLVPEIKVDIDPLVIDLKEELQVTWQVRNPSGEDIVDEEVTAFITLYDHLGNFVREDEDMRTLSVDAGDVDSFETTYDTSAGDWLTGCGYRFEFRLETKCAEHANTLSVIVRCMETAWGGDERGDFPPGGWWYYYDAEKGGEQILRAGQFFNAGSVKFSKTDDDWTVTIEFKDGWILKRALDEDDQPTEDEPVAEAVKIQGYQEGDLPGSRPPSGLFTTYKGVDLEITFEDNDYRYFAIHLDVEYIGDPGDRELAP